MFKTLVIGCITVLSIGMGAILALQLQDRDSNNLPQGVCIYENTELNYASVAMVSSPTIENGVVSCQLGTFVSIDPQPKSIPE